MAKCFDTLRSQIDADPGRRARVEQQKRAIRDALNLAQVRHAVHATQNDVAERLETSQVNVSRIEREDDLYLSTLSRYVAALGGQLEITAVFEDQRIEILVPHEYNTD